MSNSNPRPLDKIFRALLSILVICLSALLLIELRALNLLPSTYFMAAMIAVVVVDALCFYFLNFRCRTTAGKIVTMVLSIVLACSYGFGVFYIGRTNDMFGALTGSSDQIRNVVSVYAMADGPIQSEADLNGKEIGILSGINRTGSDRMIDSLKDKDIDVRTEEYSNFGPLADALYHGEVDAIAVNDVYITNITDLTKFKDFLSKTRVVYSYVYYTDAKSSANAVTSVSQEPFTVMLNGSDSRGGLGDTDRSDVNMLVTINPKTHVVLITSIPRDAYVETVCDPEYDCLEGEYDKLTHTGIHTYNTTKKTIENLLGVDINYVFRANFMAVVDIVDALGGIDVDVAEGYAVDHFWTNDMFGTDYGVTEGINHLNGEAALCYARERYAYLEGDFQRIRNQAEVLTQIAKKAASPEVIARYASLLDAIEGNFWTDLSQDEIMDFIQFQIKENPDWEFIQYSLSGQPDSLYCAESYGYASVVVLDQNTVKFARQLIQAVIDGKTADQINKMVEEDVPHDADYSYIEDVEKPEVDTEYQYEPEQIYYDTYTYPEVIYETPVYTPPVYYPSYEEETTEPDYDTPEVPDTPVEPDYPTEPDPSEPPAEVEQPEVPVEQTVQTETSTTNSVSDETGTEGA